MPRPIPDPHEEPSPARSQGARVSIESAAATHVGRVRSRNEDAVLDRAEAGLWAVADGVGGGDAGDRASALIVESLARIPSPASLEGFVAEVRATLEAVNARLLREAAALGSGRSIASTVVALLVFGPAFCCLWAGDSRIYRLKNGRLERLTRDHSEVERLVEQGRLTAEAAQRHPLSHMITRAVGADPQLELDAVEGRIEPGDVFLLCSDGLNRVLTDAEIKRRLARHSPAEAVRLLIEATLAGGAPDNVSVAAVKAGAPLSGNDRRS